MKILEYIKILSVYPYTLPYTKGIWVWILFAVHRPISSSIFFEFILPTVFPAYISMYYRRDTPQSDFEIKKSIQIALISLAIYWIYYAFICSLSIYLYERIHNEKILFKILASTFISTICSIFFSKYLKSIK